MPAFKIKLTGALLFLFSCVSISQTLRFENFTTKNGLLSDEVYNLYQDRQGYLWAFTNYGAVKYNGSEFKQVCTNVPFDDSFFYCMYENEKGRKWVANSNARIYEIVHDSAFILKGLEEVSETLRRGVSEIYQLAGDEKGNLYIITKQESYICTKKRNGSYSATLLNNKPGDAPMTVYEKQKSLFPVVRTGLEFHYRNFSVYAKNIFLKIKMGNTLYQVNIDSAFTFPKLFRRLGENLYFNFHDRLVKIDRHDSISKIKIGAIILSFTKDKNGHLWVATYNKGLFEFDEQDRLLNRYFKNLTVNSILIDHENGLWVSTQGSGLFHCNNLNNKVFNENDSLGSAIEYIKKINNTLFIGTAKGDLFSGENSKITHVLSHGPTNKPLDVIEDEGGYLASFIYGIYRLFPGTDHKLQKALFGDINNGFKLLRISSDSVMYVHRKGMGLAVNGNIARRIEVKSKTFGVVRSGNTYLVATYNGVFTYRLTPKKIILPVPNGMPYTLDSLERPAYLLPTQGFAVTRMVKDNNGRHWFCSTGNGLFMLDANNTLQHFTTANGLPGDIVNDICFDTGGNIALCTSKGLYLVSHGGDGISFSNRICLYPGAVKTAVFFENSIYAGTSGGLVIINYKDVYKSGPRHFNLSAVRVNGMAVMPGNFKTLAYNQNNLDFDFDLVSFFEKEACLHYCLSGAYADSTTVCDSRVSFKNLPPGRYSLSVTPDGPDEQKVKLTIPFTIVPAFWQTGLFVAELIGVIVAILVFSGLYAFRRYKRNQNRKTEAEKLVLEYKLIAIKAQINPHFVSNCLSAIQHLIVHNKLDAATLYIAKFGFLVRQILNFSSRSLVSLKEEMEIARLNIELEQLRFEQHFSYEISVDESLEPGDVLVPSLILNPIIENAVWHGLLPLKNLRRPALKVSAEKKGDMLLLVVEDNGTGMKPKDKSMGNIRESKGLKLTEQRLVNINYLYNSSAKIVYENLTDAGKTAQGTRVTIYLPLNLTALQGETD